ncbi:RNA polymerase sigma factor RpoH [invertebrate metagenome]|uniref:RNA polymerase sigma factor RpoH n=1 Tax=invertebrate metagenome TaxID=1711999 RepID=A0A484H5F5_9ZZZZ
MTITVLPAITHEEGLATYISAIKKFPILDPQEEYILSRRWREYNDLEAAHRLVTSHLRLVTKVAVGYRHYGLPFADLISEGTVGLMRAVKKFEPERGVRLATYALWWIRASITEFILASWSLVKTGTVAAQKKLFFRLRWLKARMEIYGDGDMTPEQARAIAAQLRVTPEEVVEMNHRLSAPDASLNAVVTEDGSTECQDLLIDDSANQETRLAEREERSLRHRLLRQALACLSPRERYIIKARQLATPPRTLEALGRHYGISRERVRQVETVALAKIKKVVKEEWNRFNVHTTSRINSINAGSFLPRKMVGEVIPARITK